jgi:hypothetical protein
VDEDGALPLAGIVKLVSVAATKLAHFGSCQGVMPSLAEIFGKRRIDNIIEYNSIWQFCNSVRRATANLMPMTIEDDLRRCYQTVITTIVMLCKLLGL